MTRARMAWRSTAWLAILLAGLLVLSSCVSMELESEFDEDGGATHSMALTIDMSDLEQFGDLGEETDPFENFDEAEREANEQGFEVERIEDGDIVGVRLTQEVDDASDLGEQLNRMFNAGAAEGEDVSPFSGTFEQDGDDYELNLTVDGASLTDTAGEGLEGGEDLGIGLDMIFTFTYTARLPGEIDEDDTNGRITSDGAVTWDLPLDSTETLTASSTGDSGGTDLFLLLLILGIIVLGLVALGAIVFFVLMNRRGETPAAATPEGAVVEPQASTYDPDQPTEPISPPPGDPEDPGDLPPADNPADAGDLPPDDTEDDDRPG